MKCDICGIREAQFQNYCNGDGGSHHHGMIHTILRGDTNDLAAVCDECARRDAAEWGRRQEARSRSQDQVAK